jgi:tetratricopeptide (TPR) repeat protein
MVAEFSAAGATGPEASAAETNALASALKLFTDGYYPMAESSFSNFLATYTNTAHRAYAVLFLARSQLEQSNAAGATALLQRSYPQAGEWREEYVFWIAKAHLSQGDYSNAANGFDDVANIAGSPLRLEAAYDEAVSYSETANWPKVISLLQSPTGIFHSAAALEPKSSFAALGALLLGEAFLDTHRYAEAENTVRALDAAGLDPDLVWRRQFLLCQINLDAGQGDQALIGTTNLLTLALGPAHQSASVFLRGQILESLGRTNDALVVYGANLAEGLPAKERRRALAKTVQLTVALNSTPSAIDSLTNLIFRLPLAPGLDLARESLGELYLKVYTGQAKAASVSNAPPIVNPLENALTNFDIVIRDFTNSQLLPDAHLNRGWCYWIEGNIPRAKPDFEAAANDLPYSEDQAVARFKLADAEFAERDYAGALTNYNQVLQRYKQMASVTNELFAQALYQIVEADINVGDDQGAWAAVDKILRWFPGNELGDRGNLLVGVKLNRRQVFIDLLKRSPNSPLAAEAEYDIARTYDNEGDWNSAIQRYDGWVTNHPDDPLLPEVEFYRALANAKAGRGTNALAEFTNFVARFPSNSLAPWAQNRVADYYFNQQAYPQAEISYQELFQKFPPDKFPQAGDLAFQARFWAGRAALANQEIDDARKYYFQPLVNDTNTPPALAAQAFFALGDAAFLQFQANPTNVASLTDAINAVRSLTNGAPTNAIGVEALGRLGDYYMHYADLKSDTNVYASAAQMYQAILSLPGTNVSVAARSQAEVGLGLIAEKEHLPRVALEHYLRVLYEYDPNNFDPYWVETAGEYAARLCEDLRQWDQAIKAYYRVLEAVPALAPVLEKRIAAAKSSAEAARN